MRSGRGGLRWGADDFAGGNVRANPELFLCARKKFMAAGGVIFVLRDISGDTNAGDDDGAGRTFRGAADVDGVSGVPACGRRAR